MTTPIATRPRRHDRDMPTVDLQNLTIEPPPNTLRRPFADVFDIEQAEFDAMPKESKDAFTKRHMFQHMWGYLQPDDPDHTNLQFTRPRKTFMLGRLNNNQSVQIAIPAQYISEHHVTIKFEGWDANLKRNIVKVTPLVEASIYLDRVKVAKGVETTLVDGMRFSFLSEAQQQSLPGLTIADKHNYVYRDCAPVNTFRKRDWFYDVTQHLGEGTFGLVSHATHKVTKQMFAIKHIAVRKKDENGKFCDKVSGIEMSLREITSFQAFSHPNIALMYEWYMESDGSIDLVLEWATGGDFDAHIARYWDGGMSEDAMRRIAFQVLEALAHLHRGGLAHRDIKPANILVMAGKYPIVKITDFGISKISATGQFKTECGTPGFEAPEVRAGAPYGVTVDSWSVGLTLYAGYNGGDIPWSNAAVKAGVHKTEPVDKHLKEKFEAKLSAHGYALMHNFLTINPLNRLSAAQALDHPWFAAPFVPLREGHKEWYEQEAARQARIKLPRKKREAIPFYHLPEVAPVPALDPAVPLPVFAGRGPSIPARPKGRFAAPDTSIDGGPRGRFATPRDTDNSIDGEPMDTDMDMGMDEDGDQQMTVVAPSQSTATPCTASPSKGKGPRTPQKKSTARVVSGTMAAAPAATPRKPRSTVARLVGGMPGAFPDTLEMGGPTSPPAKILTRAQAAKQKEEEGMSNSMRVLRGIKKIAEGA
ncbi:kinase-like domain-containing protein [Pterulicium gracile]|uniref:Kinase-like domain-containing protein n=1 Tax=Pterulicium gracile TaxID=1884261 RepID=A0A5C3QAS4_9AGAR|nr:kinase-like domain-containing protein [Pterula gracilis]